MNATYTWTYDDAGNIQYKTTYAFTTGTLGSSSSTINYGYEYDTGWDDLLLLYNGLPITYDEIGNPTKIVTNQYWASSSNWEEYAYELEWEGRQLIGRRFYELYSGCDIWYDEYYDIWFEYNADGIRTSKTAYGVEYKYILNGSQIIGETWTEYGTEYLLLYIYDENGSPIGIKYRTSTYTAGTFDYFFFEKNLQGDIVAVYNAEGEKIGLYIYDAWGNFRTTTVSGNTSLENSIVNSYNPFRYRGYYYDKDLGWYYLQTRYYNPQWGRFINADGTVSTGQGLLGNNMFAYCLNNPIMGVDPCGTCFHHRKFWNDCEKCGGETFKQKKERAEAWFYTNIEKPVENAITDVTFATIDFIYPNNNINSLQIGYSFSAGSGGYLSLSKGFALDRQGNIARYVTGGFGGIAGCGASIGKVFTVSNAPSISDLGGLSIGMGGSVTANVSGISIGGGYDYGKSLSNPYSTHSFSTIAGVGYLPAEFHAQLTQTWLID